MHRSLWIASGVAAMVVAAGLLVYGSYISAQYQMEALRTASHEQWVQLSGAIDRWADIAPEMGAAVAPVAKQHEEALDALAGARRTVLEAHDPKAVMDGSRALAKALNGVMAIGLSAPQLKRNAKFVVLRERLQTMRVRIAQDRERYNESLRNYDLFVGEFPNGMWAKIAGYKPDHHFFPKVAGES